MLADDEVLLDELDEEAQHILEAAERGALTDIDLDEAQVPTDGAATTSPEVPCPLTVCMY